jgi:hypothetical protein
MAAPTEQQIKLANQLRDALNELDAAIRLGLATDVEVLELKKDLTQAQLAYGKSISASDTTLDRYRSTVRALTEEIKELTEAEEKQQNAIASGEQLYEGLADSVLGLSGGFKKFADFANLGTNGLKGFGKGLLGSIKSGALATGALLKITESLVNFGFEQDKVIAQFKAQTGAGDEFNETIRDVALSNIAAGVSLDDVSQSIISLKNEYRDFTYLSQQQQEDITGTTNLLNKLGFSFSTQSKVLQVATQGMGMDVEEANVLLLDLASTARSLGVDVNTLGGEFEANKDFIVRFGEDGQEVFEEMAVAAKALGTDLGTLIEVTEKFKTFDSAAQSVGRLNAILGGPFLNSIDMLNASYEDPIEGIKMLRDGFDQAGVSVEDLSGAELEAFASALGLSVSKTRELLGKSNEDLEIQRMNQEELAEAAAATQDIMNRLGSAFRSVLIEAKPLIDDFVIPFINSMEKLAKVVANNIGIIRGFIQFGLVAAGLATIFSGGLFTLAGAGALAALAAGGAGAAAQMGAFADGGVVGSPQGNMAQGTSMAMVGERGPEMVEMPVGTRVTTAPKTEQLTNAITKLINKLDNNGNGAQNIAVYIGQEKVDDIVVKAMNSTSGKKAFGAFSNG